MFADLADSDSEADSGSEASASPREKAQGPAGEAQNRVEEDSSVNHEDDEDDEDDEDSVNEDEDEDGEENGDEDEQELQSFRALEGKVSKTGFTVTGGLVQAVCASFGAASVDECTPTEVQRACWKVMFDTESWARDVIAIAQTGSGKTLAFLVPLLADLAGNEAEADTSQSLATPAAVVLSPTRELARQTLEAAEAILGHPSVGIAVRVFGAIGGSGFAQSRADLLQTLPRLVIATPGRLSSFASEDAAADDERCISLARVENLVLDEADRMLDMGFLEDVSAIRRLMPENTRVVLTSATWDADSAIQKEAAKLCRPGQEPILIGVSDRGGLQAARTVTQVIEVLKHKGAPRFKRLVQVLSTVLDDESDPDALAIVFVLFKQESKKVAQDLREEGIAAVALNGDMSQTARVEALDEYKRGDARVLVATDVAARGLDVPSVSLVVNYSLGMTIEEYVHRIGRCGRAGRYGRAVTFFLRPDDRKLGPELVKVLEDSQQQVPVDLRILADKESKRRERKAAEPSGPRAGSTATPRTSVIDQDEADRLEQQRANREKQLRVQHQRNAQAGKRGGKGRRGRR